MIANRIWTLWLIALLAGCASFQLTSSEKEIGNAVLDYQLIKAVQSTDDPHATKAKVIAAIDAVESGLDGDLSSGGADVIVAALQDNIKWEAKTPEDEFLHKRIFELVKQDINERFGVKVDVPLTDEQKAEIRALLDSAKEALDVIK